MIFKEYEVQIPARAHAPATTLYVKVALHHEDSIKTKPNVFMLPGGPGFNHSFYQDYACLSEVANVFFHDPRGCGRSREWSEHDDPKTFNMENYIQDVEAIRRHFQLEQIILLGKSYGAKCALGYTIQFPAHVSNLILAAGSPNYRNLETAKIQLALRGDESQIAICNKLWNGTFKSDEELVEFIAIMKSMYSYKIRHGLSAVSRPSPIFPAAHKPLNQGFAGFLRTFNYESALKDISCPTLIVVGKEDWITSAEHSRLMHEQIKNSKLIILDNADHAIEADCPELFSLFKQFITENQKKLNLPFFAIKRGDSSKPDDNKPPYTYFS